LAVLNFLSKLQGMRKKERREGGRERERRKEGRKEGRKGCVIFILFF
jgi:hypothetical protein